MLGNIIVRFTGVILNLIGVLIIIAGTIAGGVIASQADNSVLLGMIVGFIASFISVVLSCGLIFLALEINNNLIRIEDTIIRLWKADKDTTTQKSTLSKMPIQTVASIDDASSRKKFQEMDDEEARRIEHEKRIGKIR